ncbi:MAG: dTDP-4-dehydrorhamnose reductase [Spirochaetota bacterium]|nr:dTDP-4-dehydrorhamnose reductase [Spirochaetota bacterium]
MIWLIGNKGMLGTDVEEGFKRMNVDYFASDREVDIMDHEALKNFIGDRDIQWIVNCSAYTAVDKAEDEPAMAFGINAEGVLNIVKIAKWKKARLIHVSTDYVFDGHNNDGYVEQDETKPMGIYGRSKLEGERNIIDNLSCYFIIRISWLFGKHGNNFVYTMLRLFGERDEVRVVSDQWGSPSYARDVAEVISKIIIDDHKEYGIYHFTNEGMTNWFEFAMEIYRLAREYELIGKSVQIVQVTTEEYPTRAERPKNSYLSKEKIKGALSISISSWQRAIDNFLRDIANNKMNK